MSLRSFAHQLGFWLIALCVLAPSDSSAETKAKRDVPYAGTDDRQQMLDVYFPEAGQNHPIFVWIHGGGFTGGDKAGALGLGDKPRQFTEKGFVLMSPNYRLGPKATLGDMTADIAKAIRWIHDHAREFGGDPNQIVVSGWSAGAHLAALVCTDDSYLVNAGLSLASIRGCIPIDVALYDVPDYVKNGAQVSQKLIEGFFGKDEESWKRYSPTAFVSQGKKIPPFLLLHIADSPDKVTQARRFAETLRAADISATVFAGEGKTHNTINAALGVSDDPVGNAVDVFLKAVLKESAAKDSAGHEAGATEIEIHAMDAAVMKQVVGFAGVMAEPKRASRPGGTGFEWLGTHGKTHRLFVLCDAQGRITELRGNGPWLSNEALAAVAKLPELRLIYMDHNIPPPGSDVPHSKFDGTGFSAFRDGKLESVLIGHALTNEGARALASIPTLKSMHI